MVKIDIKEFLKKRPLSWSAYSSFHYNPEQWFQNYVIGNKEPPSPEMIFGSKVGKRLETDPTFLPMIPRHKKMEHPFNVVFSGIPLVGYADSFCTVTDRKLGEFKTGKKAWDQKRVDEHGQLTMYCLMHYITTKVPPEEVEITLAWMPTMENGSFEICFVEPIEQNIKLFKTKRTTKQVLEFGVSIKNTVLLMQQYCDNHL